MSSTANLTKLVEKHTSPPAGLIFYASLKDVRNDSRLLGYVSVIERAWEEMKLNGALFLDGRPVLYLKENKKTLSISDRMHLHKLFWNQGVANVLVLADPETVYIYSGLTKPQRQPDEDGEVAALVETLKQTTYVLQLETLFHELATGHYYEANKAQFDPNQSVDAYLLDNLSALRDTLTKGMGQFTKKGAHAFIGRVLFLCYILDRDIHPDIKPTKDKTGTIVLAKKLEKLSNESRINYLYDKLFKRLKKWFNGNMFDQNLDAEKSQISDFHLNSLIQFLGGHSVSSGQRTLGFWAYDFKMIPVETISAIYQDFLSAEDKEGQKKSGAFYTPRFLAEMVVDVAFDENPDALNWSFLDPSCGSGIFLVILFNRIAKHWEINCPGRPAYKDKAKKLKGILDRQIRGVDIEETACRIACFSLYLAYLDFFNPPDIKDYMKDNGQLPKLLNYGNEPNRSKADIPVIHRADFIKDKPFLNEKFDCIIGNPPWVGSGKKQKALKFMTEAPQVLKDGGIGCLLLPSKILHNKTDDFQSEWLRKVTLEKIIQLADYSFLLFQNALCPAIIARFKNKAPNTVQHKIDFIAPKFNRDGLRQGIITVTPPAQSQIPLSDILIATESKTAPVVWKRRLWGTPRDQKLLDYLQSLPKLSDLAGEPKQNKRWIKGQGFQPNTSGKSKNPKPPFWRQSDLYISATAPFWGSSSIVLNPTDCDEIGDRFQSLLFPRDPLVYKSPMVLISQGFGKVVFCDFDVLFQHSLQSITGPPEDSELLILLAAYLRSKLAKYFLFHIAVNWGTERDKVLLHELLRIPFPLPGIDAVSPKTKQIVKQINKKVTVLRDKLRKVKRDTSLFGGADKKAKKQWQQERKDHVNNLQNEIEPLIYEYFGLTDQEIALVEDTVNIFEPSSTPTTWKASKVVTLDPVGSTNVEPYASKGLRAYADTLTNTLNKWAQEEESSYRVCAVGGADDQTGLAIVILSLTKEEAAYNEKPFFGELLGVFRKLHLHSSRKKGKLIYERDIIAFKNEQIYIVRPNILLNWTRTAALNDAARIYGDIVLDKGLS